MANRSYLYSFSKDNKGEIAKIFDISEQNYEIPIIYKILVSENTQIVPSKLFNEATALVGDAKNGRKRLDAFFEKLIKKNIFEKEELKELQQSFIKHLDKYTLDYFLFEPIEVISMSDVDLDKEVTNLKTEIDAYSKMISNFFKDTCDDCWSELGIDASNCLCFSLGDEKEVKKIEKKYSAKERLELEKNTAKKPNVKNLIQLVSKMNEDTEADKIEEILDKAMDLNPDQKQLMKIAHYYNDLDKKLKLYKTLLDFPEAKTSALYSIADVYTEKKDYKKALEFAIEHLLAIKEFSNNDIFQIEEIIEKGNFNKLEIYQKIAEKISYDRLENGIVEAALESGKSELAFEFYNNHKKTIDKISVIWSFLLNNQSEFALKIANDDDYIIFSHYYKDKKQFAKSVYYLIKGGEYLGEFIYDITIGEYAKEKVNLTDLFEQAIQKITDFKPKAVFKISKNLFDEAKETKKPLKEELISISEKLLLAMLPTAPENKWKAKAHLLLHKIYKKQGKQELAKQQKDLAYSFDSIIKLKHQYKVYFKAKEYAKSAESFAR